ncbi:unnamed protein product [Darwinula stevensoni]|uniref:Zinc finger CCCH-type with G patch domain-containing protein n=1 Tax=Darwinula stevensoni TaxID=69355 RepID=A0A7R8X2B9_9CRUS|nr:unnamed protein product [Darwinula stevensoni]CAG0883198.1 unnamed protein product [Darwinula stevensoni]
MDTALKEQLDNLEQALLVSSGPEREELKNLRDELKILLEESSSKSGDTLKPFQEPVQSDDQYPCDKQEKPLDDEFTAFQSEIAALEGGPSTSGCNGLHEESSGLKHDSMDSLVGLKCRAPFKSPWGSSRYHNAVIFHVEPSELQKNMADIEVKVLFLQPTELKMLPCPYYMDGNCRFEDAKCKFSHGHIVKLHDLMDYGEPEFKNFKPGMMCLGKESDGLWYSALLEAIQGEECIIRWVHSGKEKSLQLHDLLPSGAVSMAEEDDGEEEDNDIYQRDANLVSSSLLDEGDDDFIPHCAWRIPLDRQLGEWEKHTKGIGSKLMAKMGYVLGQGLGRRGEGRTEPVEAVVLPAGKSLDHCMALRELSGDGCLSQAEQKMRKLQKQAEKQSQREYERQMTQTDVFDFINSKLSAEPGSSSGVPHQEPEKVKVASTKSLNVGHLKVSQDITKTEKELHHLKKSLQRHSKDSGLTEGIGKKISDKEAHLMKLKASQHAIQNEQLQRKNSKKLSIF